MIKVFGREALFFLRHYNDIDHIVPVIYKWSGSGRRCTVVLIGFADVRKDYRIQFISTLACVKVLDIRDLLTWTDQLRFRFISLVLYGRSGRYVNRVWYKLFEFFWPAGKRTQFWDNVAGLLLAKAFNKNIKGTVVFDWISQKSTLPFEFVRRVLELSRNMGHISVSLPHGDSPHFNELIRNHEFRIEPHDKYAHSDIFDFIVCPNELCAKRYRPFIDDAKIKVLGSPRYNDEWLKVLHGLLHAPIARENRQTLCVVFFLRKNEFSLFWDEIQRVIIMLIQFENVRLIIKPHTRDYLQKPLKNILKQIQSPRLEIAQDNDHSVHLLAKADMISMLPHPLLLKRLNAAFRCFPPIICTRVTLQLRTISRKLLCAAAMIFIMQFANLQKIHISHFIMSSIARCLSGKCWMCRINMFWNDMSVYWPGKTFRQLSSWRHRGFSIKSSFTVQ